MNEERAADIAKRLLEAADLFSANNPYPEQTRQQWSVWWQWVPDAEAIFHTAVEDVVRSNEGQLSAFDTARTLVYETHPSFTALALGEPISDRDDLESALSKRILALANSTGLRRIQFIVENLKVDSEVPAFFGVALVGASQDDMQAIYDDVVIPRPRSNAVGLAAVNAPAIEQRPTCGGLDKLSVFSISCKAVLPIWFLATFIQSASSAEIPSSQKPSSASRTGLGYVLWPGRPTGAGKRGLPQLRSCSPL